jgi:hypothetical protein
MLATIISKIGVPFLVSVIGGALGSVNNPVAQSASKALQNFEGAMAEGAITAEQVAEANRHAEKMAEIKSKEYETALTEINETMRVEAASSDPYVRRMRPTFGYMMAVTWAAQMMALAYIVVFETEKASGVLDSMEALSTIWAMGLSVLGIYVYKRSEEKKKIITSAQPSIPAAEPKPRTPAVKPPKVNE